MNSLVQRLIQHGLLDETTAQQAHSQSMANSQSFIGYLLENKLIPPTPLAMVIAQTFGLPLLDLNAVDPTFFPIKLVNHKLIHQHHILPLLLRGKQFFLAVSLPHLPCLNCPNKLTKNRGC